MSRIQAIISNKRRIAVDTSVRLGKFFGVPYDYFISIQNDIDIRNTCIDLESEVNQIQEVMYN